MVQGIIIGDGHLRPFSGGIDGPKHGDHVLGRYVSHYIMNLLEHEPAARQYLYPAVHIFGHLRGVP